VKEKGQGRPDQKPEAQRNAHLKEAGKLSCGLPINLQEPSPEHGEGQGEPADLNVSGPNTVYAESPEAGLNDNAPHLSEAADFTATAKMKSESRIPRHPATTNSNDAM
jgi:hypothetical protein